MLHKIVNLLNKKGDKMAQLVTGDAISLKKQIIESIGDTLQNYRFDKTLQIPVITLFVQGSDCDDDIWDIITALGFEKELRLKLTNKGIYAAADNSCKWNFCREKPQSADAKEIVEGIYLLKNKNEEPPVVLQKKARITILRGSMKQRSYILDTEQQQKWNIGRGKEPVIEGRIHYNYVVIKENESNPKMDELNHNVSRKHACIVFIPNEGFKLKTYTKKDRNGKEILSSTKIQREDIPAKTFEDKEQLFLLQNDDQIVLSDSVVLVFEYIQQ